MDELTVPLAARRDRGRRAHDPPRPRRHPAARAPAAPAARRGCGPARHGPCRRGGDRAAAAPLAACSTDRDAAGHAEHLDAGARTRAPARATIAQLTANNIAFHPACLAAVAGKPFTLTFDNQDRVPHNLAIFQGSNAEGANVFRGQVFRGPRVVQEQVPALKAGDYFFHCDVHPHAMQGKLVVR